MKKLLLIMAVLGLAQVAPAAESAVTSQAPFPKVNLAKFNVEANFQAPAIAAAGQSAVGATATYKVAADQNLGLRGLFSTDNDRGGYTVGLLWRRHFPATGATLPFFEADLSHSSVKASSHAALRDATSFGFGLGASQELSRTVSLGLSAGLEFADRDLGYGNTTRVGGPFGDSISSKIGVRLGVGL